MPFSDISRPIAQYNLPFSVNFSVYNSNNNINASTLLITTDTSAEYSIDVNAIRQASRHQTSSTMGIHERDTAPFVHIASQQSNTLSTSRQNGR
jgi:hypothetical protein